MRKFQLSLKIESFGELARNGQSMKLEAYIDGNNPAEIFKIAMIEIYKIYGVGYGDFVEFLETVWNQEIERNRFGVCEMDLQDRIVADNSEEDKKVE